MNNRLVDRHLDFLKDSVRTMRRAVKTPELADAHVSTSYLEKIRSVEGERLELKKEIFSLDDVRELVQKASGIEGNLFDLRVAISQLTQKTKKEPVSHIVRMPIMDGVNLP